jgi:tetratricopeptide (TPR) repeat protein
LFLGLPGTTALAECPAPADIEAEMQTLFERARAAETFMEGRSVSGAMWEVWLRAPDSTAQEILDSGMARRGAYDFLGAIAEFDRLVDYCPDYAEGFNQRAFVHFLSQNYEAALLDLDRALELQPLHVGAQSGRALTLMNLGRLPEARLQLLEAVDNNPWLSERSLLEQGAPLGPSGSDI